MRYRPRSPVGLTLSSGGVLAGTPTGTPGLTSFTVKVTDSASNRLPATSASRSMRPSRSRHHPSARPHIHGLQPTCGLFWWSAASPVVGDLWISPTGTDLASSTGVISGTPSASGTYPFTVRCWICQRYCDRKPKHPGEQPCEWGMSPSMGPQSRCGLTSNPTSKLAIFSRVI